LITTKRYLILPYLPRISLIGSVYIIISKFIIPYNVLDFKEHGVIYKSLLIYTKVIAKFYKYATIVGIVSIIVSAILNLPEYVFKIR
jgi:hypothetical protein